MLPLIFSIINFVKLPFAAACTLPGANSNPLFGFPHWWKYLNGQQDPSNLGHCVPAFHFPNDILAVVLAIIDILLRFAGLAAVISIIIAGIGYITSIGNADKVTSSRKRIQNSLIGLAIVFVAAATVSFIGNNLK